MRDQKVSALRVAKLHPKIRDEVAQLIEKAEEKLPTTVAIRIVQGLRTFEEQKLLYDQPHDGIDNDKDGKIDEADEKVTNAIPGKSFHQYGLAIDFCLIIMGKQSWKVDAMWLTVVKTFKDAGYKWGGDFKSLYDGPHLEKTFGYTASQLLEKYNKKDFIPNTIYLNL